MLNISPEKIVFLLVVALVVLGPQRLPAAAKSMGKLLANLRQMTGNLQSEMNTALAEPREMLQNTLNEAGIDNLRDTVQSLHPRNAIKPLIGINPLAAPANPPAAEETAPTSTTTNTPSAPAPPLSPVAATGGNDLPPAPDDPALN